MSKELNNLLKKVYNHYKDQKDSPVPLKTIKEFLELEGVSLDGHNKESLKI